MARPIVRATLIATALAGVTLTLLVWAMLGSFEQSCEVCVTYHGRTECRRAAGGTEEEAMQTAQDNACAFLAAGMAQVIECGNTRPASSSCD